MSSQAVDGFERLVGQLNYPVFIVTTRGGGQLAGCLVGFATQGSIHPPSFLIGLSRRNHTFSVVEAASHLAVHIISRDRLDLARLFGSETGDAVNKFDRCEWRCGPADMPILEGASAWFVGIIAERFDLGDHVGHLLRPVAADSPERLSAWVTFADVSDFEPGHEA